MDHEEFKKIVFTELGKVLSNKRYYNRVSVQDVADALGTSYSYAHQLESAGTGFSIPRFYQYTRIVGIDAGECINLAFKEVDRILSEREVNK